MLPSGVFPWAGQVSEERHSGVSPGQASGGDGQLWVQGDMSCRSLDSSLMQSKKP